MNSCEQGKRDVSLPSEMDWVADLLLTTVWLCASHLTSLSLGFCKNKMRISSIYLYQLSFSQENRNQYMRQKGHLNWESGVHKTGKIGRTKLSDLLVWPGESGSCCFHPAVTNHSQYGQGDRGPLASATAPATARGRTLLFLFCLPNLIRASYWQKRKCNPGGKVVEKVQFPGF